MHAIWRTGRSIVIGTSLCLLKQSPKLNRGCAVCKSRTGNRLLVRWELRPYSSANSKPGIGSPSSAPSTAAATEKGPEKVDAKVVPKIKTHLIYDDSVKSIKYITPLRAMKEYLLSSSDMDSLPKYYSRSPYISNMRTLVFMRSDVENLAFQKHGGKESFELRRKIAEDMDRRTKADVFSVRKALKYLRRASSRDQPIDAEEGAKGLFRSGAGKVVLYAICINGVNCVLKSVAWWYTGSKSMFSEMMHSVADTLNQILLAYGLHSSFQKPDEQHPYGYTSMRNVFSLISGVGIFFLGSGLSIYHGIQGILYPHSIESMHWALFVMSGSLFSEGATLIMAYSHASQRAREQGSTLYEYLLEGTDPTTMVVLLEDTAAVLGVMVAGGAMGLSYLTGSHLPDALGAVMVGSILAGVAYFVVRTNADLLIGKSIPNHKQDAIMRLMDKEKIIRGTYDIKATLIGGDCMRFKAEVDIDGRELTKRYLETIPLDQLLKELERITTQEELIHFMLRHGDNIVNTLGAEINKIEDNIRKEFPAVKHIDIEIN